MDQAAQERHGLIYSIHVSLDGIYVLVVMQYSATCMGQEQRGPYCHYRALQLPGSVYTSIVIIIITVLGSYGLSTAYHILIPLFKVHLSVRSV